MVHCRAFSQHARLPTSQLKEKDFLAPPVTSSRSHCSVPRELEYMRAARAEDDLPELPDALLSSRSGVVHVVFILTCSVNTVLASGRALDAM